MAEIASNGGLTRPQVTLRSCRDAGSIARCPAWTLAPLRRGGGCARFAGSGPLTEVAEVVRKKHSGELVSSSSDVLEVATRLGGGVRRVGHDGLTPHEVVERHWQTFVAHRPVSVYDVSELPMLGSGVRLGRACVLRAVVGDVEASREAERRKSGRRLGAPSATGVDRYHIVEIKGVRAVRGRSPQDEYAPGRWSRTCRVRSSRLCGARRLHLGR